jgi:hypothetical protein
MTISLQCQWGLVSRQGYRLSLTCLTCFVVYSVWRIVTNNYISDKRTYCLGGNSFSNTWLTLLATTPPQTKLSLCAKMVSKILVVVPILLSTIVRASANIDHRSRVVHKNLAKRLGGDIGILDRLFSGARWTFYDAGLWVLFMSI